ncbi:keratin, type I cytoskeletal 18-like, partial [Chelydra serpentina]
LLGRQHVRGRGRRRAAGLGLPPAGAAARPAGQPGLAVGRQPAGGAAGAERAAGRLPAAGAGAGGGQPGAGGGVDRCAGPPRAAGGTDWSLRAAPGELRKQVEDLNMDNAKLLLQIDNARLAADDFKVKLEGEQAVCDSVQKDTQGLRKIMEDTNFLRMKLEAELEGLKEELAHLRKSHKEEVEALRALIANSDVTVEVDNPKKQELKESIAQIRKQYEKVAEQNRDDAESWYKDKFDTLSQEANVNTQALEEAKSELSELRRQLQGLEIERQTLQKMVDTLENTLENIQARYNAELANLNHAIAKLQEELAACRADLERQARDYEALLDLKSKLENEISQYSQLIEGVTDRLPEADH